MGDLAACLIALRRELEKSIIGQPVAIDAIIGALERYHAGLHDDQRPIGSFLFLGPTGTGKSYCVEQFARFLFGSEGSSENKSLIRLDCSEFSLEQDIAKIFGAAPGYIGSDSLSTLSKLYAAVPNKDQGFILLLDEVEKAHRKFFDTWLQVLENGKLTDSKGNVMDFTRAMIFMTSNVGAEHHGARRDVGFRSVESRETQARTQAQVEADLRKAFKPEFINRITARVHFTPLSREQQRQILGNLIGELNGRLARHLIRAELTAPMFELLITQGFSTEFGARELKRVLSQRIEQPLARAIIHHWVHEDSLIELSPLPGASGDLGIRRIGDYPILLEETALSF